MFQQPLDFRDESEALYRVLATLSDADFARPTQFKQWTVHDVVSHLHAWNWAADLSLRDAAVREPLSPPWRELLVSLRRMESRGEVRGGRFLQAFIGEQFALPEALDLLRAIRRSIPR